ncbi:MAG: hypothetical protein WCJ67_12145 [Thermoleophilia bacterium]
MGGPPRTTVKAVIAPVSGVLARFALSTVRRNAMAFLGRPGAQALLDAAWLAENLSGCALLSTETPPRDVWPDLRIVRAHDPVTTLNVLGRSRGGILVASAPLVLDLDHLDTVVFTEDSRLVALAARRCPR